MAKRQIRQNTAKIEEEKRMEEAKMKEYYGVILGMWKLFKSGMSEVENITDAYDPKWLQIVSDFEAVYKDAPRAVKPYANDMMLVHVKALEDMWRWKK